LSSFYDEEWLRGFSEEKGFKILLCHHPEYYDRFVKETDIGLVLSGHNHGGQFRLFGKGLISSSSGLFPKYDRGIFENRLVISAGCSNTAAVPRLCNPREVVIIKLSPE
jgi:predicted MPP superfamily phosphohydrolase